MFSSKSVFRCAAAAMIIGGYAREAATREVDLRDYLLLREGMSEAEVLYRLGPYDHETVFHDFFHFVIRKTWSYIPDHNTSGGWITEITFDSNGRVQKLERTRP